MSNHGELVDTNFDFRTDATGGDVDSHSPTLRRYHRALWSKPLPGGAMFDLEPTDKDYLLHRSELGEFSLSSDSILPTFTSYTRMAHIIDQIPQTERDAFLRPGYTIGGFIVFPSVKVDGKDTINAARGKHPGISDRIDLTLECIRRHYLNEDSPLSGVLARYAPFFALFEDFDGYVNHFLLQDLVTADGSQVAFFLPFEGFPTVVRPRTLEEYAVYRDNALVFVQGRNARIDALQLLA